MLIIPGKIPYIKKGNLKIEISTGTMIDQEHWVDAENHDQHFGSKYLKPYENISAQIFLNKERLIEHWFNTSLHFEHEFVDTDDTVEHELKIDISGFDPKFCRLIEGIGNVSPMVKINVLTIEDLNMKNLLEDCGKCFYNDSLDICSVPSSHMGQNGYQLLEFKTPIYPWLLENERKDTYYL